MGTTWNRRLLILGVWLTLFVTNPGRNEVVDVGMRQTVARRIWSAGSVTITSVPERESQLAWIPTGTGTWAAPYGIGQSVVFVPFDFLGWMLERLGPAAWREQLAWLPIGLGLLPLLGVGWWLAVRKLLEAWGISPRWSLIGSLAMTFGTMSFHYLGQAQEESLVGFFLTLSMLFAVRLRTAPTIRNALLAGAFGGACLLTRPVSVFALSIVPVLLLSASRVTRDRIRFLAGAGASFLASLLLLFGYNAVRFGSPFAVGYDRLGHLSKIALDARSPRILAELLVGPGVGLFVLSPILLLVLWGMRPIWRRDRAYAIGMTGALVFCYVFFSAWHDSTSGGVAWGTRYQCHLLPIFAIPLTLGLQRMAAVPWSRTLAIGVVVLSIAIQGLSVFTTQHFEYVEATCQDGGTEALLTSPIDGQLERRARNLVRWVTRSGPPDPGNAEWCRSLISLMWDRYVPNSWGPVFGRRIHHGGFLIVLWGGMAVSAIGMVYIGARRRLSELPAESSPGPIPLALDRPGATGAGA
jgi:hypothetical protein